METRDNFLTHDDMIANTEPYCLDYDFEPVNAIPADMSWTSNEKWFMSGLAVQDIEVLLCLN